MCSGVEDCVLRRFEVLEEIGSGAYGTVWRALDRTKGRVVALKKIIDAFRNCTDALRTYREVILLRELGVHKNVVKLLEIIPGRNNHDLYLVFEYMDTDLHAVIRAGILQPVHVKYIMRQLVRTIHYMHSAKVLHRDLKPGNLLINANCLLKVCDFGLARSLGQPADTALATPILTDYVATRYYRAPELLLGSHQYTTAVDIWALGCIFAELLSGKVLFRGGSTFLQLEKICEICPPTQEEIAAMPVASQLVLRRVHSRRIKSLEKLFSEFPRDAVDLLLKCLVFNPDRRLTTQEALAHPFMIEFAHQNEMTVADRIVIIPTDDGRRHTVLEYRSRLLAMAERDREERRKDTSPKKGLRRRELDIAEDVPAEEFARMKT